MKGDESGDGKCRSEGLGWNIFRSWIYGHGPLLYDCCQCDQSLQ